MKIHLILKLVIQETCNSIFNSWKFLFSEYFFLFRTTPGKWKIKFYKLMRVFRNLNLLILQKHFVIITPQKLLKLLLHPTIWAIKHVGPTIFVKFTAVASLWGK